MKHQFCKVCDEQICTVADGGQPRDYRIVDGFAVHERCAAKPQRPPIVLIESPYRNGDRNANLRYLTWCEFHSASMGEVPIASHANCTAYWPEDEEHQAKGFAWRDRIRSICNFVAYYTDLGVSPGAQKAMERDEELGGVWGITLIKRTLPDYLLREFQKGQYPAGSMRRVSLLMYQRLDLQGRE